MTVELSYQVFADRLHETFVASREGSPSLELELVEVKDLSDPNKKLPKNVRQDPFRMLLRGPLEPILPQCLYTLSNDELGEVLLFVVPAGPEEGHMYYNIIIN